MPNTENFSDAELEALTRPAGTQDGAAAQLDAADDTPPPPPRDGGTYLYDPLARTYTLVDGTRPQPAAAPPAREFCPEAHAYLPKTQE